MAAFGTAWIRTKTRWYSTIFGRAARRLGRSGARRRLRRDEWTSLVTGARGFVGGWLAKGLLKRGERVVSFDKRRVTEKPSAVGMLGIEEDLVQVEGDLCDAAELERVLRLNDVDTVFHLAAETIVSAVQESPVQGFESNVRGTWTLLQACLERGVERVVFASSDKAYGAHETLPYREDFPLQPTAPYEASVLIRP